MSEERIFLDGREGGEVCRGEVGLDAKGRGRGRGRKRITSLDWDPRSEKRLGEEPKKRSQNRESRIKNTKDDGWTDGA